MNYRLAIVLLNRIDDLILALTAREFVCKHTALIDGTQLCRNQFMDLLIKALIQVSSFSVYFFYAI